MPEPGFNQLHQDLLDSGVSPRVVRRTIVELRDHYQDLKQEITDQGISSREAGLIANRQLGKLANIAAEIKSRRNLRHWSYRYPTLGRIALPLICVAALPIAPIVAGVNHAHTLARWAAILTLSAIITTSLFLVMQISISLG